MAEHFVLIVGLPNDTDTEILLVAATSSREAHMAAAAEYRRKRDLASSVFVRTHTAHRSVDEAGAVLYMARLLAHIEATQETIDG